MDAEDIVIRVLIILFVVVPIIYYLVKGIIEGLSENHIDTVRNQAVKITLKYPNALHSYLADHNKSINNVTDKELADIPESQWVAMEKEAKDINHEYSEIINRYYDGLMKWVNINKILSTSSLLFANSKTKKIIIGAKEEIIELNKEAIQEKWTIEQNEFSSHCRSLFNEILESYGCFKYDIKLPIINTDNSAIVWQFFSRAYCLDKKLDYSLNISYLKNGEFIEQHRSTTDVTPEIKRICQYINRLDEEDTVSVYINFWADWDILYMVSVIENILAELTINSKKNNVFIYPNFKNINHLEEKVNTSFEDWCQSIKRRVVIVDFATENKQLKQLCNKIAKGATSKRPLMLYCSIFKCHSSVEMKNIIKETHQKVEEQKQEEIKKQEELKKKPLDEIPGIDFTPSAPNVPKEEYEKGIIISDNEIIRVSYDIPQCKNASSYCYYISPEINNVVFPYRRRKTGLRGYTEERFENRLRQEILDDDNYLVLGDVSILPTDDYHPYEPDIAIVEKTNKYGLRIDIEIDEPYSGYEREPIHYIECGDEYRDKNLANNGWLVIRFSENQIFQEPYACLCYIKHVISQIDKNFLRNINGDLPKKVKRWSEAEANQMIIDRSRETLLKHEFGAKEQDTPPISLFRQSEFERKVAAQVKPIKRYTGKLDSSNENDLEKVVSRIKINRKRVVPIIAPKKYKELNHEFVDLGLNVRWATCNIGADHPEDFGCYFSWGEIETKDVYDWTTYKYYNAIYSRIEKYNNSDKFGKIDNLLQLVFEDDPARTIWGGDWRMPTKAELLELMSECTWVEESLNGVIGYKITSKKRGYTDRSIFLPAAGYCDRDCLINEGSYGHYWIKDLFENNPSLAYSLRFESDNHRWSYGSRRLGLSIRPVFHK